MSNNDISDIAVVLEDSKNYENRFLYFRHALQPQKHVDKFVLYGDMNNRPDNYRLDSHFVGIIAHIICDNFRCDTTAVATTF